MMRKIAIFVLSAILALTAGLVVACADVNLKKPETKQHTVTYYYNYSGAPSDVYKTEQVDSGTAAKKPTNPTRTGGYTFKEWTTDAAGNTAYNFSVTVKADLKLYAQWRELSGIEATVSKTYQVGDTFSKSDITVTAKYNDNSSVPVTDFTYTAPDMSTSGDKEITVSYGGKSTTVTITVDEAPDRTLSEIKVTTQPTKKEYNIGDALDKAGMVVKAYYSDETNEEITDYTVEFDSSVAGDAIPVLIKYNGKQDTFTVKVKAAAELVEIKVTTQPTKKEYNIGDALDKKGMVVKAYYSDETDKEITDYTVEFDSSVAGEAIPVLIKYNDKKDTFTVKVKAAELVGIALKTEPNKLKYEVGDDFDDDGMELTAIYSDSSREPITSGWTINNFDSSKAGTCTITVTYKGFTTTESFEVEVEQTTYQVKFVTNLDTPAAPKAQTVNKGEYADAPTGNFDRNGYTFLGWFNGTETTAYKFTTTPVTDDITLTAKWEKKTYNITYHLEGTVTFDGDDEPTNVNATLTGQTTTFTVEDKVDLRNVKPTISTNGVTFVAWHKGSATGTVVTEIAKGTYEHIHLYAEYTTKSTVTFYFDYNYTGAGDPTEQPVVSGLTASQIENPTRTGYDFGGWYNTSACAEGDEYNFATAVEATKTVYAKWTPKTLTVTFKPENGAADYTADVAYDAVIPAQPDPTRKLGHQFAGWFRINGGAQWDFAKTLEEALLAEGKDDALTLEAHWTADNYDVVFKNGDTVLKTESITFGATIPEDKKPADQTKLGHKFEGWYWNDNGTQKKWTFGTGSSASKLTTEGLELIATFTAKQYEVTYVCGDNQAIKMVTFGQPVPASTLDTTKTGYLFDGWYWTDGEDQEHKWDFANNATLQTEGLTLTAKWNAKDVTVKFVDGSTEYEGYATTAKYDGKVTKPATPEKAGYTFLHWHILDNHTIWVFDGDTFTDENGDALPVSIVKQTSTLTLQAHWEAKEYTITYNMGDHANALTAEEYAKYTYGKAFTLPNTAYVNSLVKTPGYSFEGWYNNAEFDGDPITAIPANTTAGNKTFYAKITQNSKVQFTFNLGYGESTAYQTLNPVIGTKVAKPVDDPERDHYRFTGWYNTSACNEGDTYNFNEIVTQATTVYAGWTPIQYEITFDTDDGREPTVEKRTNAQTIEAIAEPSRTGYDFIHWYVSAETQAYTFGEHPTENITLKAHWELHEYTVTFDHRYQGEDGKYVTSTKKVKYTNKFTAITAPSRDDGYTFSGFWYKDIELTDQWDFDNDTMPAEDLTLYAKWNRNYYTVTFMDGTTDLTALKKTGIEHGSPISKPTTNLPTRTSHHLKKNEEWKLNNGTVWNFGDPITRNIILNANWEINTYTVEFSSNGGTSVESQTVNHGATATKPADPTKSGFTFAGWTLNGTAYNFTEEVTDDIILVANWEGATGTFLYYTTDGTNWNYGYKAEKNGSGDELVIPRVNISNGMEFRIVTKKDSGSNIVLKAGMTSPLTVKDIFTVAKNGDNFKLTFTNANYNGSVWTMYIYGLSGVTVASDGSLNKDGTASGVSLVQQHETTKFTPDNKELTSTPLASGAANTIYIPGSFTDGFKLYKEWSNAADGGMLVLTDGNTYTFRHVYLKKLYGFKINLPSMGNNGWFGGIYNGLNETIALGNQDDPDINLVSQFVNGWYDLVFTNGTTKTLVIKPYAAPTVASVTLTAPTKTEYWQGEPFDKTGMEVSYTDTDGKTYTAPAGSYTVDPSLDTITSTTGTKTVTVTYADIPKSFTVTVNALTVTFNPNGGSMPDADKTKTVLYNGKATKPATATRTGYHLVTNAEWRVKVSETEWEVWDFNTAVTAPITLYANWEINKYTVTFSDESGASLGESVQVDYNTLIPANKVPDTEKEGWLFTGWKDGNNAFDPATDVVTKSLQLVAYYTRISYDVKFIYDDGVNSAETVPVNHGDTVADRSASRTGYTFDGWFEKDAQGQFVGEKFKFNTQIKRAYTLTAKWTVIEYTIDYNLTGTVEIGEETVSVDATIAADAETKYTVEDAFTLAIPTVATSGASFLEWRITVDGTPTTIEAIEKGSTGNITLQAVYTANALVSFTFNYNYTGAPENVVRQVTSGTTTAALAATRTGYTFLGWYEKDEQGEYASESFNFTNPVEANTVVYAKWSTNTHKVTFNAANGYWLGTGDEQLTTKEQANVEYGSTVTLTDIPTRPGYTFKHWSYNSAEYLSTDIVTMPDADIELIAVWQLNTYTVKYNVAVTVGGAAVTATKPADATYRVTGSVTLPTSLSNVTGGYKFTCWTLDGADIDEITLATFGDEKEVTLTAKYEIITYTVEYWVDGVKSNTAGNPASYDVTVGDKQLDTPTHVTVPNGYTFDGWYTEVEGEGENIVYKNKLTDNTLTYDFFEDKTEGSAVKLYGRFTINKYTVTFNANGGYWMVDDQRKETLTKEVTHGGTVERPANPSRDGHNFGTWNKPNNTEYSFVSAVEDDITLTATWTVAAKVDGLYNVNTLVKELNVKQANVEFVAKPFKVETASEVSPFKVKMYINNEVVTSDINIKDSSPAKDVVSSNETTGELSFKKTGVYMLYYKYDGGDLGIYVKRLGDVADYQEPNVVSGDGVLVGGTFKTAFEFNEENMNQVMATNVVVSAANATTAVEVTFKYGGVAVTPTKVETADGVTNIGLNGAVKLYNGTYDFYYNYGKNADGKAGRLWIQGTQTGGINLGETSCYVAGSFNDWASANAAYKFDSNGVMELDLNAGDSFKIVKGGSWLGYNQLSITANATLYEDDTANQHNIKIKSGGTYQLIFDGSKLTITKIVIEAPNIAVGKYIVLDKLPKELTAADKFTAVSSTCYKIEFEISEATVVKIWNQTSTTAGNYEVVKEVHLNGGAKIEPVDTTMQAGKYKLEYNVYDNGAWVRLDFTKEVPIETTNQLKGTKVVLTGTDSKSITIYLANATGSGVTLSEYKMWAWGDAGDLLVSDGQNWDNRPTVTANMTAKKALGDKISFKFTKGNDQSTNLEDIATGKTYIVTIGANLELTIQEYVAA